MRLASLASTALILFSLAAHADTLDQQTSGTNPNAPGYFGQNFVINGTGSYTNITFNFYAYPSTTTPYAAGTGYLFSESYGGTPAGLSSAADNFLGSAPAVNGVYTFAALVLPAGHNYFFYEAALLPEGTITGQAAAENMFYAATATSTYTEYGGRSNDYLVTGISTDAVTPPAAATPEPSSLLLLGTGMLSGLAILKRRFA